MNLILYQEAKEDPADSDVSLQASWFLEIMKLQCLLWSLFCQSFFQAEDDDDDAEDEAGEDSDVESKDESKDDAEVETKEDEKHVGFLSS